MTHSGTTLRVVQAHKPALSARLVRGSAKLRPGCLLLCWGTQPQAEPLSEPQVRARLPRGVPRCVRKITARTILGYSAHRVYASLQLDPASLHVLSRHSQERALVGSCGLLTQLLGVLCSPRSPSATIGVQVQREMRSRYLLQLALHQPAGTGPFGRVGSEQCAGPTPGIEAPSNRSAPPRRLAPGTT